MAQDMPVETRTRGWALGLLLVLMSLGSCAYLWFAYLILMSLLGLPYHPAAPVVSIEERLIGTSIPSWYPIAILIITVLNVVFLIAVWRWKKWGVLGLYGAWFATVAASALAVDTSAVILAIVRPLIPLVLLGFLAKRKWQFFE